MAESMRPVRNMSNRMIYEGLKEIMLHMNII